jgi:hypothetical protein
MAAEDLISYLKLLDVNTKGRPIAQVPVSRGSRGSRGNAQVAANTAQKRLAEAKQKLESQGYDLRNIEKSFAGSGKNAAKVGNLSIKLAKAVKMGNSETAASIFKELEALGSRPDAILSQFDLPSKIRDSIRTGDPAIIERVDARTGETSYDVGKVTSANELDRLRGENRMIPKDASFSEAVEKKVAGSEPTPPSSPATAGSQGSPMERQMKAPDAQVEAAPTPKEAPEPADMMKVFKGEKITLDEPAAKPAPPTDMVDLYKGKPIVAVADSGPAFSPPKEPVAEPAKVDMDRAMALFQNTHGGPFDPKSSMDKGKLAAIQNLMAQKGSESLTPNQFSLKIYRQSK